MFYEPKHSNISLPLFLPEHPQTTSGAPILPLLWALFSMATSRAPYQIHACDHLNVRVGLEKSNPVRSDGRGLKINRVHVCPPGELSLTSPETGVIDPALLSSDLSSLTWCVPKAAHAPCAQPASGAGTVGSSRRCQSSCVTVLAASMRTPSRTCRCTLSVMSRKTLGCEGGSSLI